MPIPAIRAFLKLESAAGMFLVAAAALALLVSNSPWSSFYTGGLELHLALSLGQWGIDKPLLLWINDGLMAIFFLLVGLEVKREILDGELSSPDQVLLPAAAAMGGFVLPAGIYAFVNWGNAETIDGWAIPAATDIAFALGVLSILGSRVPVAMKVLLTTIAIFDDIAAIVVIAVFYTDNLSLVALFAGAVGLIALATLNRLGISRISPYVLVGIVVWICVLKSGVHATLAGFAVAFAIPLTDRRGHRSPLRDLEHALHPWVAYGILPVFAFANAGIPLAGIGKEILTAPVSLGIASGLVIGKQAGVFGTVWLMVRLGFAKLPGETSWLSVYGLALLTGIGFTMSLFIGSLAFEHGNFDHLAATRIGVFVGSLVSAVAGLLVLRISLTGRSSEMSPDFG